MSPGHALSGVTVWLGCWATAQSAGMAEPRPPELIIGSVVAAGAACLNDLDHPQARITNSLGPVSKLLGWTVAKTGAGVHALTRTPADATDKDGHRTITHTLVFALATGWGTSEAGARWGAYSAALLVLLLGGVGVDAVLSFDILRRARRLPGRIPTGPALTLAAAIATYFYIPGTSWWLGAAVAVGCFTHCLGDCITSGGCPFLWPLPLPSRKGWKMWRAIGPPKWMRFRVGGKVEAFVSLLLASGAVYAGWRLVAV